MDPVTLARWQFGITTVYHFLFVPITIGLVWLVAVMQTKWYRTGDLGWLRLTKFFGKLFLINFTAGVVTGIVQEFQFGMNWSEYSRFVGDIFGAPLALEALIAFFLESTFIGLWIFGWERLPKRIHLATIYLVAVGSSVSAIFILAANSWMQNPIGATYRNGRAELTNFGDLFTNPFFIATLPHTLAAAFITAGGLVCGVAGWWMAKSVKERTETIVTEPQTEQHPGEELANELAANLIGVDVEATANKSARRAFYAPTDDTRDVNDRKTWRAATRLGAWVMVVAAIFVMGSGHYMAQTEARLQPMKLAASEGHFETQTGAPFSIVAIFTADGTELVWSLDVPYVLSILAFNDPHAEVLGIVDLQEIYSTEGFQQYDGSRNDIQEEFAHQLDNVRDNTNFVPNVWVSYYSFRLMMGLGLGAAAIGAFVLFVTRGNRKVQPSKAWTALMISLPLLPLAANSFGWILTEMGRQPWIVNGVLLTQSSVSATVAPWEILTSMILFTLVYGIIAVIVVSLFLKQIQKGLVELAKPTPEDASVVYFAY